MSEPLHPIEKSILSALAEFDETAVTLQQIVEKSSLSIDQVRRGVEWLKAKHLVEVDELTSVSFSLGPEGRTAAAKGLPERRLVDLISEVGGTLDISSASKSLGAEFAAALGRAKKNNWIKIEDNKLALSQKSPPKEKEEVLIERFAQSKELTPETLSEAELGTIDQMVKWHEGFILRAQPKSVKVRITLQGRLVASTAGMDEIDVLTPQILQSGEWKDRKLRPLDVTSPAPTIYGGRKHPMRIFMDEVRETFVSLGFEEILGPNVQSALWNFDALFIPQEHSAREMQDTFYVSGLKARLDDYRQEIDAIKGVHETGSNTGSAGWRYRWREDESARVVLRTHTTAVTISYLAKYKPSEARVFSVGRVFRNEKSNYKHNPEFFQIEGVMVGEKLNIRNLIYILSKFYSKLGFDEIKFWPTYFPYTEPSLQTMALIKETGKWMELGGMGIFRPEVTLPLGIKNTVLAWGLSLDRLVMLRYGVNDIRQLFGANLDWLRHSQLM